MLAKDSVQQRLERGLSFTEFSYMTLQAYDFATLYREHGVEMQMGGADQWGNITAGLELIRRTSGDADESPAHGIAYKLLLSPSGAKFGKSEGGDSVWLDPERTTPYAFYQYWVQADDRDVGTYLRWFTELPRERVEALDAEVAAQPGAARRRSRPSRSTSRRASTGRGRGTTRCACPGRCSSASRSATRSSSPASTRRRGARRSRRSRTGWPCCWRTPAWRRRAARPGVSSRAARSP